MRILVIEDDREAAGWLIKGLAESGHVADHAADGEEGLEMAYESVHDVLIVDRMLPKIDGLTIIRKLRENGNKTPVLILSALSDVDERVKGLRAGGDVTGTGRPGTPPAPDRSGEPGFRLLRA